MEAIFVVILYEMWTMRSGELIIRKMSQPHQEGLVPVVKDASPRRPVLVGPRRLQEPARDVDVKTAAVLARDVDVKPAAVLATDVDVKPAAVLATDVDVKPAAVPFWALCSQPSVGWNLQETLA